MNEPLTMSMFATRKDYDAALEAERREGMVEALVADFAISLRDYSEYRNYVARSGYVGFANMSMEDLERAYRDAGLDEREGE